MDYAAARAAMVENQLRVNQIADPAVIEAMAAVPREAFVPAHLRGIAYVDEDLPLGNGRYLIEPLVLARLLQAAAVEEGEPALVIGDASGYPAAVLAHMGAEVVVVESDAAAVAGVAATVAGLGLTHISVRHGPLTEGVPDAAPFAVILFAGAVLAVPGAIFDQLGEDGRLVAVIGAGPAMGQGMLHTRASGVISRRPVFDAATPLLPGFEPNPSFVF